MHIKNILLLLLLLTQSSISQDNQIEIKHRKIIALLKNKIKKSENQYLEKGLECKKKAESNRIEFDKNIPKEVDIEAFETATMYLVRKNMRMCVSQEKKQLVYDLNKLMIFKNDKDLNIQNELDQLYILLSDTDYYFYDEIKYQNQPEKIKKYFENIFKDMPYGIEAVKEFASQWKEFKSREQ